MLDINTDQAPQISSDHYPLIAKVRVKLRKVQTEETANGKRDVKFENNRALTKEYQECVRREIKKQTSDKDWSTEEFKSILEEGRSKVFPIIEKTKKKDYISSDTWKLIKTKHDMILKQRIAIHNKAPPNVLEKIQEEVKDMCKSVKKAAKQDRKTQMEEWVDEQLDIRDQWLGIKKYKLEYKPRPYDKRDKHGNKITIKEQAEATADYLENQTMAKER